MKKSETYFDIDLCGDCVYYGECKRSGFLCEYALSRKELVQRVIDWYKKEKESAINRATAKK
jgi:hypothetical protein